MNIKGYYKELSSYKKLKFKEKVITSLKISESTFYSWIRKNKIPARKLEQMAKILKVDVNELNN